MREPPSLFGFVRQGLAAHLVTERLHVRVATVEDAEFEDEGDEPF